MSDFLFTENQVKTVSGVLNMQTNILYNNTTKIKLEGYLPRWVSCAHIILDMA